MAICDNFISETDNINFFAKKNIAISCIVRIRNRLHEQIKFPMFWHNFQIPCVFHDREFFGPFFCFPCAVGTLYKGNIVSYITHTAQ